MSDILRVAEVMARIEERVPELAGRLASAAAFAQLVANGQLPQQTPAGFVLHGGLNGGKAQLAAGAFRQDLAEMVLVVLCVRVAGDALGDRGLDEVTPLVRSVIEAVVGWGPATAPGVFVLSRGELVGSQDSTLIYQLDFSLDDQLRIFS